MLNSILRNEVLNFCNSSEGEGEGEVAFFSAKRWDRRNRADLIKPATLVMALKWLGPRLHLTVLATKSEDYTTGPQHLQQCLAIEFAEALTHHRC